MIVQMDKMSAPPREIAQRLHEKNIELDSRRRKSAQARVPLDPNIWQQMRENYETIILEDHAFSEQHNIEHALWQLHYKKIEELRAHYSAAQASVQGGKGPARPDRIAKIRLQFKTFLSEATGFYHDLIMKIRAKYGLPLGYFSEESENRIVMEKDVKKSAEMKKGLISCHRCLIYLGDLARYKGLYGEANSKSREYTAASSYYLQAASLWPSIGNPHHQLAILASYSGDDFLTVYRYFRSLAVDNPCSTARDNLIVAFEKNRQSFAQLPGDIKAPVVRLTGRRQGREVKLASKENDAEAGSLKDKTSSTPDAFKSFCIRFVRLNGILFTRTSLETFAEVLSLVSLGLYELLSSGKEEELKFGANAREIALFFVRLVAILIFTVQNSKKENEGQTYVEIVQRAVLLQNAFSAAFEIVGLLLERCEQLQDPSSSYLLPGVLVFVEWLACCPDVASGSDADEKQAMCRSNFWAHFVSLTNKLLSTGSISVEDNEEETCFYNMSRYEEGENENRLALLEDFELRGFLPLLPAQTILDFSRKHSFGGDDQKERSSRVKRILAAGKALLGAVKIDQKSVHYDAREKKFVVGAEPPRRSEDFDLPDNSIMPPANSMMLESKPERAVNSGLLCPNSHSHMEFEEEDEVIVFRPTVAEKPADVHISSSLPSNGLEPGISLSGNHKPIYGTSVSGPPENVWQQAASDAFLAKAASIQNASPVPQHLQPVEVIPNWLLEEESSIANSFQDLRLMENGHGIKSEGQNIGNFHPAAVLDPTPQSAITNSMNMFYSQSKAPEPVLPTSRIGAVTSIGFIAENLAVKTSASPPPGLKKNPVSRPVRHVGPPPGFGPVPKQASGPITSLDVTSEDPINDDYSWLDGYQMPPPGKSIGLSNSIAFSSQANSQYVSGSTGLTGAVGFPFPGKQAPINQFQMARENGQQDYPSIDYVKLQQERHMLQANGMLTGNHEIAQPEQYQGSVWAGRYFV
ncbi:protein SMG7 [Punica granatum]|nr:protein SMG7 [Punica granatum]XP_031385579.1 protein SMG7 [Punica granatum]XP_031385580.1 protein SMG7 [Punica granatum]XP_031385581.1 protein SMG7 [Punica granatum]